MNRRWFLGALAALVVAGGAAEARMHAPYRGHRIVPASVAPLDGFTTPTGAYSFRKLRTAYAGNAIRLRRASDNLELDIGFLGFVPGLGAPWDEAVATAHCAATTCFSPNWYDQSGVARNLAQATAANQPQLIFNCNGTLPCLRWTANTQFLQAAATVTPATGAAAFSGVGQRTGGNSAFTQISENGAAGNRLAMTNSANSWAVAGGTSGTVSGTATEGVWHAVSANLAGAASVINIDGVETTGTATGSVTAALPRISAAVAPTVTNQAEAIFWDNYQLTVGERTALRLNQQSYWGTP